MMDQTKSVNIYCRTAIQNLPADISVLKMHLYHQDARKSLLKIYCLPIFNKQYNLVNNENTLTQSKYQLPVNFYFSFFLSPPLTHSLSFLFRFLPPCNFYYKTKHIVPEQCWQDNVHDILHLISLVNFCQKFGIVYRNDFSKSYILLEELPISLRFLFRRVIFKTTESIHNVRFTKHGVIQEVLIQ